MRVKLVDLVPLAEIPSDRVEWLLDAAFGIDRRSRTAYRIRAGTDFIDPLSFAAMAGDRLIGLIQCWPIALEGDDGTRHPLVMVGPVAVDPAAQRTGLGRALMVQMLAVAEARGEADALMLIGDPEYYERFFGFTAASTNRWRLPGPVEQRRVLARGAAVPAIAGMLGPRLPIPV